MLITRATRARVASGAELFTSYLGDQVIGVMACACTQRGPCANEVCGRQVAKRMLDTMRATRR